MQQGDATHFPYDAFLSWENTWHAYGNVQAYALMIAGAFLNNPQYNVLALAEVDNFYPWLLQNGYKSSFAISDSAGDYQIFPKAVMIRLLTVLNPWYLQRLKRTKKQDRINMLIWRGIWLRGSSVPMMAV